MWVLITQCSSCVASQPGFQIIMEQWQRHCYSNFVFIFKLGGGGIKVKVGVIKWTVVVELLPNCNVDINKVNYLICETILLITRCFSLRLISIPGCILVQCILIKVETVLIIELKEENLFQWRRSGCMSRWKVRHQLF